MKPIRVLIVDDAVVARKLLTTVIDDDPDLEVVGIAASGAIGLAAPPPAPPAAATTMPLDAAGSTGRCELVAIGSSTGGPNALAHLIGQLPAEFDKPIVIAQHMPAVFTRYLAQRLDAGARIRVREAAHGELLEPGLALIAPGDHHMTLRRSAGGVAVVVDQKPSVNFCRPSVDVLFRSAAEIYDGHVLGVVLTGMGHDGRDGCAALKRTGATVIVQDQASSMVWGMPGTVHQSGLADATLPLDDIADAISAHAGSGARIPETI